MMSWPRIDLSVRCRSVLAAVVLAGASAPEAIAGPPCPGFLDGGTFGAGNSPQFLATDDLDGDSDLDLVVLNGVSNNISVLLNLGDGTFANQATYGVGTNPRFVAIGDLDGDGHLDIASANRNSNNISILLNDGDGTFTLDGAYNADAFPHCVRMADFDGDGDLDLAAANSDSNTVSILLNAGDGTFPPDVSKRVGSQPFEVWPSDLDGDGDIDLAVANVISDNVSILLGTGSGTFANDVLYPAGDGPRSITAGDLDDDGDQDLVVANGGNGSGAHISVLFNAGNATFGSPVTYGVGAYPQHVELGDLDADGDLDLAVANSNSNDISVLLNAGNGTFGSAAFYAAGGAANAVPMGDFDGDGDLDLAVANAFDNNVSILLNQCASLLGLDCNGNGVCDGCDVASGTSSDCNADGTPDECHPIYWTGILAGGGGDWDLPAGWDDGVVPDFLRVATFDGTIEPAGLSYSVPFGSDVTILGLVVATDQPTLNLNEWDLNIDAAGAPCFGGIKVSVYAGETAPTRLFIDNTDVTTSMLTADWVEIDGDPVSAEGRLTVKSDRVITEVQGAMHIGRLGRGAVELNAATTMDLLGDLSLGLDASGDGLLTVRDGADLELGGPGLSIVVGGAGIGAIDVMNGGRVNPIATGSSLVVGQETGGQGTISVDGDGSVFVHGGAATLGNAGEAVLQVTAGGRFQCEGELVVGANAGITVGGQDGMLMPSRIVATSLTIDVGGEIAIAPPARLEAGTGIVILKGGELCGLGTIDAPVFSVGSLVLPTPPPGADGPMSATLTIEGNYQQIGPPPGASIDDAGLLTVRAAGPIEGADYGQLDVQGTAELGGGLVVSFESGFEPTAGQTLTVLKSTQAIFDPFDVVLFPGLSDTTQFLRPQYGAGDGPGDDVDVVVATLSELFDGFGPPEAENLASLPSGVAVADFDGVNGPDLAVAIGGAVDNVIILFNAGVDGGGDWLGYGGSPPPLTVGVDPSALAVGNLDGANGPDLVVSNASGDSITVVLNNGAGILAPGAPIAVDTNPQAVAVGNFSGDLAGHLDIAVANTGSDSVFIFNGNGTGAFPAIPDESIALPGPTTLDPRDLDDDKDTELIVAQAATDEITIIDFGGVGPGLTYTTSTLAVGDNPESLTGADVDGNGRNDVIVGNRGDGTVSVILNVDGTSFEPPVNLPVGADTRSVATIDLEGDMDFDIAVIVDDDNNPMTPSVVQVLRNDGSASGTVVFADAEEFAAGDEPAFVVASDLDGDGIADLVVVNEASADGADGAGGAVNALVNIDGDPPPCPEDLSDNGAVDFADILAVIAAWGPCGVPCPEDLSENGDVDFADILAVIAAWGSCPSSD